MGVWIAVRAEIKLPMLLRTLEMRIVPCAPMISLDTWWSASRLGGFSGFV